MIHLHHSSVRHFVTNLAYLKISQSYNASFHHIPLRKAGLIQNIEGCITTVFQTVHNADQVLLTDFWDCDCIYPYMWEDVG